MSTLGSKIRLNCVALIGDGEVGKILICIDEDATVDDLASNIRAAMQKGKIHGRLLRLTNIHQSYLPGDERVGDVLRDEEEVVAVLTREPEDPAARQQLVSGGHAVSFTKAPMASAYNAAPVPEAAAPVNLGPSVTAATIADGIPGPVEVFEDDVQGPPMAFDHDFQAKKEQVARMYPKSDWEVDELTPKLREYIVARFREMHDTPSDPGRAYLTVSMRPHERPGAIVSPLPVHYSVARVDLIEFERLSGRKVQETRTRHDHFSRCFEALNSLLDRGASREDYVDNMLPYRYREGEEVSGLLEEVDEGTFGQVEGFRPIIVIDTSGALGENLAFVKAALKRLLYSFMVTKSRFNVLAFNAQGRAMAWEDHLVPPVAQKLREVEQFIDSLQPAKHGTDILEAMRWALQPSDADSVYLVTAGFPKRADVAYCLADIRSRNLRQLPIHVIGVECEARNELDLRRLAEENRGSFKKKHFHAKAQSVSLQVSNIMAAGRSAASGREEEQRLSIGGQMDILEVMISEQEIQITTWLEEQKCANRILLSSATQHPVPDEEQARYAAGKTVVNQLCRAPPPPLRDLIQGTPVMSARSLRPESSGRAPPRRGAVQPAQRKRSNSAGRRNGGGGGGSGGGSARSAGEIRRPSVANPWDRPSGVVRVSQMASTAPGRPSSKTPGAR